MPELDNVSENELNKILDAAFSSVPPPAPAPFREIPAVTPTAAQPTESSAPTEEELDAIFSSVPAPEPFLVDEEEQAKQFPVSFKGQTIQPMSIQDLDTVPDDMVGQPIPLPKPYSGSGLYQGLEADSMFSMEDRQDAYDKAVKRYNLYKYHPDSQISIDGVLSYKGVAVSPPEMDVVSGEIEVGTPQLLYLATTRTLPENVLGGIGALMDAAVWYGSGENIEAPGFSKLADNFVEVNTADSILESILVEGTAIAGGMAGGAGIVSRVGKSVKEFPKLYAGLQGLAMEVGSALGSATESETILFGDRNTNQSMIGQFVPSIMVGVTAPVDSPEFTKTLAKRTNVLLDGLLAGKVVEMGARGTVATARLVNDFFFRPFEEVATTDKKRAVIVSGILDKLTSGLETAQQREEAKTAIVDMVRQYKDVAINVPIDEIKDVQVQVDTLGAILRALDAGDTSKASELLVKSGLAVKAAGLKKAAIASPGLEQVAVKGQELPLELERVITESEELFGGPRTESVGPGLLRPPEDFTNVTYLREAMQQQGVDEVEIAKALDNALQIQLRDLETTIEDVVRTDPSLFQQVSDLEMKTGIDMGRGASTAMNTMIERLTKASELMDAEKNAKFAAVVGGEIDTDRLVDILLNLKVGQLDAARKTLPANDQVDVLLSQLTPRTAVDPQTGQAIVDPATGQTRLETIDEVKDRFRDWAEDVDGQSIDFAFLFKDLRPGLTYTINKLEASGEPAATGAARTLIKLKRYIDEDAIADLKSTDPDVADNAEEALRYFKDEWAKYWDDGGALEAVGALRRNTVARNMQPARFMAESRRALTNALTPENEEFAGLIVGMLGRPEGGQSAPLVVDYIVGKVFENLETKYSATGKLVDMDLSAIRQSLNRFGSILENNFPSEAVKIIDLADKLGRYQFDRVKLLDDAKIAKQVADNAEQELLSKELGFFFRDKLGIPVDNGLTAMLRVFKDPLNGQSFTREIYNRTILDLPAREGLKSAYLTWLKDLRIATESAGGVRPLRAPAQAQLSDLANTNWEVIGREVFRDNPKVIEMFRQLFEETSLIQKSGMAKRLPLDSETSAIQKQMKALESGITATLGVLSRPGAQLRNLGAAFIKRMNDPLGFQRLTAEALANPDEFIRIAEKISMGGKIDYKPMIRLLVKAGIYRPETEGTLLERTAKTLKSMAPDFLFGE